MNFRRENRREEPEINLIPLIDVVLVIIIFLVLTTTFSTISGLEINLPTTTESQVGDSAADEIEVAINAAGEIMVNRQTISADQGIERIEEALKAARAPEKGEAVVIISADAKASHQSVIDVMQAAQRAGLIHVTFAVQTPPK